MEVILQIAILIMSAVLHEVAHGYVALSLGDPTAKLEGRLTLNPFKHLDPFGSVILPLLMYISTAGGLMFGWAKPVPYNPYNLRKVNGPAYVALAGPATNLLVAVIFGLIVRLGNPSLSETFLAVASLIVVVNVLLAVFNLIPLPPLDGSKVLAIFLPRQAQAIEEFLSRYQLIVLLFILFFGWRIIRLPVIALSSLLLGPGF
jgi:Zn-dependent protease